MTSARITTPPWQTERRRRSPRWYPWASTFTNTLFGTAGSFDSINTPNYLLSSGIAASAIRWKQETLRAFELFDPTPLPTVNLFDRPWIASAFMREVGLGTISNWTGGGIAIGDPSAWPPPNNDTRAWVMLRARHAVLGDEWVLTVNPINGPTTHTVLAGVDPPSVGVNATYFLELQFVPSGFVRGFVNGILGAEQTVNLPSGGFTVNGFGIFSGHDGPAPSVTHDTRFWEGYAENPGKWVAL